MTLLSSSRTSSSRTSSSSSSSSMTSSSSRTSSSSSSSSLLHLAPVVSHTADLGRPCSLGYRWIVRGEALHRCQAAARRIQRCMLPGHARSCQVILSGAVCRLPAAGLHPEQRLCC